MASSPLSSPLLPPLASLSHHPHSSPLLPFPLAAPNLQRGRSSLTVVSSSGSRKAYTSEEKQRILEGYGLDPSDFVSKPSSQRLGTRRRGEEKAARKGRRVPPPPPEKPEPPRTTHKLLQVLGGKARRKKLLSPKGMDVRPMMEVVRGAAFDILQVAGGCPASLRPGRWLDLYSGTGSVGIEAISRGCSESGETRDLNFYYETICTDISGLQKNWCSMHGFCIPEICVKPSSKPDRTRYSLGCGGSRNS